MVVRRESGLVSSNTHVCTLDPFGGLLSRPQTAISLSKTSSNETSKGIVNAHFNLQENHRVFCSSCRDCFSRNFPRAREGWWGWRPFRRRRDVHWRGWFSRRRIWWARFSSGRKNVWRRIQSSPLLWRLQRLCGEPVQSVAKSIFVALYVLKRGEASPTGHRGASSGCTEERSGAAYMSQGLWAVCLKVRRLHKTSAQLSWSKAFAHVTREAPVSKAR
jgi:hypothetical protein